MPETIKSLGTPKNKINGENVPQLNITDTVLVRCNIVKNYY